MDVWNRQELYEEVWQQPLIKIAPKYNISNVMLGKICRKLLIPVPGRGYWARKAAGQRIKQTPLPNAKNQPVIELPRKPVDSEMISKDSREAAPAPTDLEYLRIQEMEGRTITMDANGPRHKLVGAAEKLLGRARVDSSGIIELHRSEPCLELRVSKDSLGRALVIMQAIIPVVESEGFRVGVDSNRHGTSAQIFGHRIDFAIVEKLEEVGRHEVIEYGQKKTVVDRRPSGVLEFRIGDFVMGRKYRDRKKQKLENILSQCIAGLMREGRDQILAAERQRIREIEERRLAEERWKLAEQIREEEARVQELETWVSCWSRAKEMRDFIVALEANWKEKGEDLTSESPKGQRLRWMQRQADRIDPLVQSPPSVLDRKRELARW